MACATAPIDAIPDAHIYCHICRSIQPLVVDDPQQGDGVAYDFATDLVCGACQFVVATAYTPGTALTGGARAERSPRPAARR